jgi:hypothetical protein
MKNVINRLIVHFCLLFVGCSQEVKNLSPEMETHVNRINELIAQVCRCGRDRKPIKDSIRLVADIASMTNAAEQNVLMKVVCKTMSNTVLEGMNMLERQSNYANLHYFRERSSSCFDGRQSGLYWQLELWFSEVECFKKEETKCRTMVNEIKTSLGKEISTKINPPLDFNVAASILCEWETSEQQSQSWYKDNMAMIVLWDDSVAARYCATVSWWEKMKVVRRIKKAIGRYPDWYLEERKKRTAK